MHKLTILVLAMASMGVGAQELAPKPAGPEGAVTIPNPLTPGVKINPAVNFFPRSLQNSEGAQAAADAKAREGAKTLNAAMLQEVAGFDKYMGERFSIALLQTSDPLVRGFIAGGVLKINPDIYSRMESGLASVYVENGKINGQTRRVCYVLSNPDRALHLWRSYVPEGSSNPVDIGWAARYLVAHEVGHCLDRWQRTEYTKSGSVSAATLAPLGVPQVAFDRTFGAGRTVSQSEWRQQQVVLYRDGALMQYQERVADAFAVLWMMGQRAPNENLKPIWDTRMRVAGNGAHHAHATVPALQKAYAIGMELKTLPSLDDLWQMARKAQMEAGVDPSLGPNSKLVNADAENREAAPAAKPGQISAKPTETAAKESMPAVIRFDRLPQFGSQ